MKPTGNDIFDAMLNAAIQQMTEDMFNDPNYEENVTISRLDFYDACSDAIANFAYKNPDFRAIILKSGAKIFTQIEYEMFRKKPKEN